MRSHILCFVLLGASLSSFASSLILPDRMDLPKYWGTEKVWWHGRANFSGEVLTPACTLVMEDRWQTIDMGDATLRQLQHSSSGTEKKFSLRFDDCDLFDPETIGNTSNRIRISFDGISGENQEQFRFYGSAKGVDLQILDSMGYKARLGEPMVPIISEEENKARLNYLLRVVRNSDNLQSGSYYASIRFNINYE